MKYKEVSDKIDEWKKTNADRLKGWSVSTTICTNADGEVDCVDVWLSKTINETKPRDHCCDPPVRHVYGGSGLYATAEGTLDANGKREPITADDLERILAALLAAIS